MSVGQLHEVSWEDGAWYCATCHAKGPTGGAEAAMRHQSGDGIPGVRLDQLQAIGARVTVAQALDLLRRVLVTATLPDPALAPTIAGLDTLLATLGGAP